MRGRATRYSSPVPALSVAALLVATSAGCQCDPDRPYTPFRITAKPSASSPAEAPLAPSAVAGALPFVPRAAAPAPAEASQWTLDGVSLGVDLRRRLDQALTADFDADGNLEAVAWTRPKGGEPDSQLGGELVLFSATGAAAGRVLAGAPPFLPGGPGCKQTAKVTQTGPRSVTLEVAAVCTSTLVPRSPTRGISVIAPLAERPLLLALRTAEPAAGESFSIAIDSSDRDGDGRDDARLAVTLGSGGNDQTATLPLLWLDRAAGAAREALEPSRSLSALASIENVRAPGKTTGRRVPLRVENARRLYATLCAESGTARLFDQDGAPLACGDLTPGLGQLVAAEVRAWLGQKEVLRAIAALERGGWFGEGLPARLRASVEKEIRALSPERVVVERSLGVAPRARAGLPQWSPLTFEPDGSLLIQTADGILQARSPEQPTEDVSDVVEPWPLLAGGPGEPRWTGVAFSCDRGEVLLLQTDEAGAPLPATPTTILAPRPGPCRAGGATPAPALRPVEWNRERTVALLGLDVVGAPRLEAPGTPPRGGPFSADGRSFAAPWARGLAVVSQGRAETWLVNDPAGLSDCVPAPGGRAVACVRGSQVVWLQPSSGPEPPTVSSSAP